MTSGAVVPVVMESKIPRETHRFTWNIADFAEVKELEELLKALSVTFDMGQSIGLPVTFRAYLKVEGGENEGWTGWRLKLEKAPRGVQEVITKVFIKIGNSRKGREGKFNFSVGDSWGWARVISENGDTSNLPLDANGALPIEIAVTLFNPTRKSFAATVADVMAKFEERFARKLSEDLEVLYKDPTALTTSETPAVVSVVSKNGRLIGASSAVLAARSPVFRTMFQTPMKEVKEGVVKMEDIGGEALEVFLHFLHTAALKGNWKETGVLEELAYAAHKYLMQDLLEFLDEAIGLLCAPANCLTMIPLTHRLELQKATEALLKKYQDQWKEATGVEGMIELLQE